jgi:hypothetical protein
MHVRSCICISISNVDSSFRARTAIFRRAFRSRGQSQVGVAAGLHYAVSPVRGVDIPRLSCSSLRGLSQNKLSYVHACKRCYRSHAAQSSQLAHITHCPRNSRNECYAYLLIQEPRYIRKRILRVLSDQRAGSPKGLEHYECIYAHMLATHAFQMALPTLLYRPFRRRLQCSLHSCVCVCICVCQKAANQL